MHWSQVPLNCIGNDGTCDHTLRLLLLTNGRWGCDLETCLKTVTIFEISFADISGTETPHFSFREKVCTVHGYETISLTIQTVMSFQLQYQCNTAIQS